MPEIKHTFLAGKMNKSLDDRLVPEGEYRDAKNVEITTDTANLSGDVGTLRKIKGNSVLTSNTYFDSTAEVIGSFFDDQTNNIYYFITDDTGKCGVYEYNVTTNTETALIQGNWLLFSKNNIITGINVLEGFLYWTDNLNQPRRINISKARTPNYYQTEESISVVKYSPYLSPVIAEMANDTNISSRQIEQKFVRFAYRYKFEDNEYSTISPFSNIAFRPKDAVINTVAANTVFSENEKELFGDSIFSGMVNGINYVKLNIDVPADKGITSIEILYKESDSPAIRIVDTKKIADASNGTLMYEYKSTVPKSTLPEDQLIRVYDNMPITAQAQEIVSNRLVYGNISLGTKYDLPEINYNVFFGDKDTSVQYIDQLENHSLKQRRLYTVGIILSDIYGRSTPVYLSNNATVYVPAKSSTFDSTNFVGNSLKVLFTNQIPNAYNGDPNDPGYNPLGWYSYKIVVKQPEQEYYNVYTSGVIDRGLDTENKSYIELIKDNVNKVPRDSTNSFVENDTIVDSKTRLYPKVINTSTNSENSDGDLISVTGIAKGLDFGAYFSTLTSGMYNYSESPLLARLGSNIGVQNTVFRNRLAVFETEPFISALDIYYETVSTGKVSDLNTLIQNGPSLVAWSTSQSNTPTLQNSNELIEISESTLSGTVVATLHGFSSTNPLTELIQGVTFVLDAPSNDFELIYNQDIGKYQLRTKTTFTYGIDPIDISITGSFSGLTGVQKTITFDITNAAPSIVLSNTSYTVLDTQTAGVSLVTFTYTNGSVLGYSGVTLLFSDPLSAFSIVDNGNGTGYIQVSNTGNLSAGSNTVTITASDNGQTATASCTFNIVTSGSYSELQDIFEYALSSSFSNTSNACNQYIGGPWSAVAIIYAENDDPMNELDPKPLYGTSGFTKYAASGWYKDTRNGIVGLWYSDNTNNIGYWQITPYDCGF